jgi:hypothetical protein
MATGVTGEKFATGAAVCKRKLAAGIWLGVIFEP